MKTLTLTKPYDLFDLFKSNIDSKITDNLFYPYQNSKTYSNIIDYDEFVNVELFIPGFKKEQIEITIDEDLLKVQGKKEAKIEKQSNNYILNEYNLNEFSRNFKINPNLDLDKISSTLENGILTIKIPKTKKTDSKKIIKIE